MTRYSSKSVGPHDLRKSNGYLYKAVYLYVHIEHRRGYMHVERKWWPFYSRRSDMRGGTVLSCYICMNLLYVGRSYHDAVPMHDMRRCEGNEVIVTPTLRANQG